MGKKSNISTINIMRLVGVIVVIIFLALAYFKG